MAPNGRSPQWNRCSLPDGWSGSHDHRGYSMMDTIVLAIGLVFFGLCFAYVAACDAL
ncbi:hypothetical protein AB4Z10_21485 [Bosea sp. RAF48]|uniref:hypothetical protein n=1 Tax=Bosea sp. RAF48 TaxID=3237480 RepID=UPI003F8E512E